MIAFSSFSGTGMAGSWPVARVMAGASAVPVSHAIDLAFFFSHQDDARQDALQAESRRHLGGCVASIEMALRLSLDHMPAVAAALDRIDHPVAWPMIRAQPELLSPSLLAHMRLRGALTLMLRHHGQSVGEPLEDAAPGEAAIPDTAIDGPGMAMERAAALALAEGRWLMPGGEESPMRADLPAEHFAELVWTVAACLALAIRRGGGGDGGLTFAALERSGWALLADHDERAGPLALADELVRDLGDDAHAPIVLGRMLDQRRFILFVALAARRLRMDSAQLADILLLGPVNDVSLLCRLLGASGVDHRQILLCLRPARPSLSDAALLDEAERYEALDDGQADEALALWRCPSLFRAKMAHLCDVAMR